MTPATKVKRKKMKIGKNVSCLIIIKVAKYNKVVETFSAPNSEVITLIII